VVLQEPLKAEAACFPFFFLSAAAFLSALALTSAFFFAWISGQHSFLARHSSSWSSVSQSAVDLGASASPQISGAAARRGSSQGIGSRLQIYLRMHLSAEISPLEASCTGLH
jgi:hypothetical protein